MQRFAYSLESPNPSIQLVVGCIALLSDEILQGETMASNQKS